MRSEFQVIKAIKEEPTRELYRPRTIRIYRQRSFLGFKWWVVKEITVHELVNY